MSAHSFAQGWNDRPLLHHSQRYEQSLVTVHEHASEFNQPQRKTKYRAQEMRRLSAVTVAPSQWAGEPVRLVLLIGFLPGGIMGAFKLLCQQISTLHNVSSCASWADDAGRTPRSSTRSTNNLSHSVKWNSGRSICTKRYSCSYH